MNAAMFPTVTGIPGNVTDPEGIDSLEDEPTITEIMKNPSKVIQCQSY